MNIRNILKVLFVSFSSILLLVPMHAQPADSSQVHLGYDISVAAD